MIKKLFPLGCLLTAAFMTHAQPELKGTASELAQYLNGVPRTVAITGEAELKKTADRALLFLRVVTENKSLQEAARANQEIRSKMLRTLPERGVPADRVQASKFSSTPKYGLFGEKAKSYRVENVVRISANDEKEFQVVAGLVDTLPEVRYDSIEFEHSNKTELKQKALEQAIDKATEKKRLYETKLGVKLTPKGFAEGATGIASPLPAAYRSYVGKNYPSYTGATPLNMPLPNAAGDVGEGEATPNAFAELVYKAQVTVEYAVETK